MNRCGRLRRKLSTLKKFSACFLMLPVQFLIFCCFFLSFCFFRSSKIPLHLHHLQKRYSIILHHTPCWVMILFLCAHLCSANLAPSVFFCKYLLNKKELPCEKPQAERGQSPLFYSFSVISVQYELSHSRSYPCNCLVALPQDNLTFSHSSLKAGGPSCPYLTIQRFIIGLKTVCSHSFGI